MLNRSRVTVIPRNGGGRWAGDLARTFQLTRRVAGDGVAVHAGFANVKTLSEILRVEMFVALGNASTLLI